MAENETQAAAAPAESEPKAKKDPREKLFRPKYNLAITTSPHDYHQGSVPVIMWNVVGALTPALLMGFYLFGLPAVILTASVTAAALLTEIAMNKIMGKKITVKDGSAAITGLLLAMTLPPSFPVFLGILGAIFGIVIGKSLYGGLGNNIFNPALLGRAFLQASFPVAITTWTNPSTMPGGVDAVTAATPLGAFKFEHKMTDYMDMFLGFTGGTIGETSAVLVMLGGLYLLARGYADWRIPVSFIGSTAAFAGIFWLIDPSKYADPLFHILAGGLMLGAFFMATDMVTSPVTNLGSVIFGVSGGLILVIIRTFGPVPEAVMYTILLMNAFTPLINRYTRPQYLGEMTASAGGKK